MKKYLGIFVITTFVCGFWACGGSKTNDMQQDEMETGVEQTETDSSDVFMTAVLPHVDTAEAIIDSLESGGFGRCLESGCYCKEFKGRGQTCQNCGHSYKRHY